MTLATSCPQCGTAFRVRSEQLRVRGGMVRCGVCKHVFRALDALRALEAEAASQEEARTSDDSARPSDPPSQDIAPAARAPENGEFELAVPAFDEPSPTSIVPPGAPAPAEPPGPASPSLDDPVVVAAAGRLLELDRSLPGDAPDPFARPLAPQARALDEGFHSSIPFGPLPPSEQPAGGTDDARTGDARARDTLGRIDAATRTRERMPADEPLPPDARLPSEARQPAVGHPGADDSTASGRTDALFASSRAPRRSRAATLAGVALVLALGIAAALQATLLARDTLAARFPASAPAVSSLSAAFGLRVGLPRRLSQLTIEGFDLQAAPGSTQLAMTAVLRNTGDLPLQWPAMEITLTDTTGEVVVRKALQPADYLRGTPARLDSGIAAGTEVPLRLALQGPAGVPTGYTVNLFYP